MRNTDLEAKTPFELLQDLQIRYSLLTVAEEKNLFDRSKNDDRAAFLTLRNKSVLIEPASFTVNADVLSFVKALAEDKNPELKKIDTVTLKDKAFITSLEKAFGIELADADAYGVLKRAVNEEGLITYWSALEIVAYHSFKSRKVAKIGETYIPLKTKKQFEYYFRAEVDETRLGYFDIAENHGATLVFDGSEKETFEPFYTYVQERICGNLDRQRKRGEQAPLWVWHDRFKDELTIFFKAKVGGNGYAKDYLDSKIRELQRAQKKIKGLDEAALIKDAFLKAIETGDFTNREYTCLIASNRGYSAKAISRFTGFSVKEVAEIIEAAIPKAAVIIYKTFCLKYQQAETAEGYRVTENLVSQILKNTPPSP
ncbi:MAG: hypothetical protein HQ517_02770 [SAR324 cluster bacterium]|nr:hypothetical protein [SAR324 cluster bacterium]